MGYIFLISIVLFLLADSYCLYSLRLLTSYFINKKWVNRLTFIYILLTLSYVVVTIFTIVRLNIQHDKIEETLFIFGSIVSILYLPKFFFVFWGLIEDLFYLLGKNKEKSLLFLIYKKHLLRVIGLTLSSLFLIQVIFGMSLESRYDYQVKEYTIVLPSLPAEFDGLKIVHLSDWHLGGFLLNPEYIEEIVEISNSLNPDMVFHTGDIISYYNYELEYFMSDLKRLKAPLGQYACLGNHDDTHYITSNTNKQVAYNLDVLDSLLGECNIHLLRDENINIHKNNDSISIIGLGYDKTKKKVKKRIDANHSILERDMFSILLLHDPTFWDDFICNNTDISLTLSGHTHGMQYGINIFDKTISPSQIKYKHSFGLFNIGQQFLHVSTGLGQTIVPFRYGMPPEIVLITLKRE